MKKFRLFILPIIFTIFTGYISTVNYSQVVNWQARDLEDAQEEATARREAVEVEEWVMEAPIKVLATLPQFQVAAVAWIMSWFFPFLAPKVNGETEEVVGLMARKLLVERLGETPKKDGGA